MSSSTLDRRLAPSATPTRTIAQRFEALTIANEVRTKRARLKRDLKAGRASITDVILEPPSYAATAKVFDLLLAVPKWGRVKVNKTLVQAAISPSKTLGGLSRRQRSELASRFVELERVRVHNRTHG